MNHVIERSGRMVPALDFDAPVNVSDFGHRVPGLEVGTAASGLPIVSRIHPVDGKPESFGVFATQALAENFHRTFGSPDTCPEGRGE